MKRPLAPFLLVLPAFAAVSTCAPRAPHVSRPPVEEAPVDQRPPLERLRALGVTFRPWTAPAAKPVAGLRCGVDDGVRVLRGPTGVRYSKPPRTSAAFAVRLARFEQAAQEEAMRTFGEPVKRIDHVGTYVCRAIAGTAHASQHAAGNAIDVSAFVLRSGRRVVVSRDFAKRGTECASGEALFLRRLTQKLAERRIFGAVLTPDFDRKHATHLHLDGSRRWGWGRWPGV